MVGCSRRGAIKVYGIGILYLQKRDLGHEQNTRCVDRAYVCTVCTLHSQSVHTRIHRESITYSTYTLQSCSTKQRCMYRKSCVYPGPFTHTLHRASEVPYRKSMIQDRYHILFKGRMVVYTKWDMADCRRSVIDFIANSLPNPAYRSADAACSFKPAPTLVPTNAQIKQSRRSTTRQHAKHQAE